MMAGGASLAPRRWSLAADATTARSSGANLSTARMTAAQNTRNCALSCGVSPGSSRLPCVVLPSEKLTCLPEPLTPAKGFSWSRQAMPYFSATRRSVTMMSCWWSVARLAVSNTGATSYWPGRHLVVARLDGDAELVELALALEHEREHALGDGAEVVVLELLPLRRRRAEERAAGRQQVGPREVEVAVDQEVLLLGAGDRRRRWRACRVRRASARAAPAC